MYLSQISLEEDFVLFWQLFMGILLMSQEMCLSAITFVTASLFTLEGSLK